ncbi:MAG: SpoIIIAH-like family protein [Clostridia bacterium]
MKNSKRQIILGSLILALGAAVYLNWQFTEVVSVAEVNSTELESENEIDDSDLGIAALVNSSYVETVSADLSGESDYEYTVETSATMSDARISRQTTRDAALEILEDILEDLDSDSEAKTLAVEETAKIAQDMLKESSAENAIKAKGIDDVVVFINEDICTVIVSEIGDDLLIVQEIIVNETGFSLDNINIIEAQ